MAKYATYGAPRLSGFFAISYGLGFAALTATLSHVALWHGKEIYQRYKASSKNMWCHCEVSGMGHSSSCITVAAPSTALGSCS